MSWKITKYTAGFVVWTVICKLANYGWIQLLQIQNLLLAIADGCSKIAMLKKHMPHIFINKKNNDSRTIFNVKNGCFFNSS